MSDVILMVNTGRRVLSVATVDEEFCFDVSSAEVDEINLYWENGEMAEVPYLQVKMADGTEFRVAARHYEVQLSAEDDQSLDFDS